MKRHDSLIPSRRQWKHWTIPSKHTTLGLLAGLVAIVLTLVLGLPPFLDWCKAQRKPAAVIPPPVQYGIISSPERYQDGLAVHGVAWRSTFSRHTFSVVNASDQLSLDDFRLFLLLPAGIVAHKFLTLEGCQDVVPSQYNPPGGIVGPDGVIRKIQEYFRNDLMVSAARIGPGGRFTLELVVEYRGGNDDAGWCEINYAFGPQPTPQTQAIRNRILVQSTNQLSLHVDDSTNMASHQVRQQLIMMPDRAVNLGGVLLESFDIGYPARENAAITNKPSPR